MVEERFLKIEFDIFLTRLVAQLCSVASLRVIINVDESYIDNG